MAALNELSAAKVPQLTLLFWIIKVAATTLGETGGDAVSMSMDLGYLLSTGIFAALFAAACWRWWSLRIYGRGYRARCCSGSPSCSRDPSTLSLVTISTSR